MIDCLFVGMNSQEFGEYLGLVKGFGTAAGAYRDLNLSFIEYDGRPYQAMDLLSRLYVEAGGHRAYPFHNADFIWPTITYLATYISRRGFSFDYINSFQYEKEAFLAKLSEDPLTVVIPTTLYVVPWPIQEILQLVRQHNSKTKVVVGGPYIANVAKSASRENVESQLRALGADYYIISSEGEAAFAELLGVLKSRGDLSKVPNLAYRERDRIVFAEPRVEQNPLEENMVDYSRFGRDRIGQFLSTRTAKSCPFACSFCNFPQQAGQYTYMGVEAVERELDAIRDLGCVTTLTFIDDTFNVPKKRFHAILEMMIRKEYARSFKWNCTFRCDHADDETISLMARAGCEGVFLGVESGSDRMLSMMNKTARRRDYSRAIPRLKEEGILAHANVFIGFPGETLDTVAETMELIRETRPETYSAQPWYANPLTPIWKKKDELAIHGSSFQWSHKTMDSATACDLVDRAFLTLDESIFLPQYGFFQWSLFYLQRQGMPLDRIKRYLHAFNALVREKMVHGGDERVHAGLMAALVENARFDGGAAREDDGVALYSGQSYAAAEAYSIAAFGGIDTESNGALLQQSLEPLADSFTTVPVALPAVCEPCQPEIALAGFTILLWSLNELQATPVIACLPDPVPLTLQPDPDIPFDLWAERVRDAVRAARPHRLQAFGILTGGSRLLPFSGRGPRFRAAFCAGANQEQPPYRAVPQGGDVLLELSIGDEASGSSPWLRGRCREESLSPLARHLETLLGSAANAPRIRIGELARGMIGSAAAAGLERYRSATFAF